MNRAVHLALLSMDSYNRGYGASLNVDGSKIGHASLQGLDDRLLQPTASRMGSARGDRRQREGNKR